MLMKPPPGHEAEPPRLSKASLFLPLTLFKLLWSRFFFCGLRFSVVLNP